MFVGENFVTPPTLGSLWTIWSSWALLYLSRCAIGYFLWWPPILFISSLAHMS